MRQAEPFLWIAAVMLLTGAIVVEGRAQHDLLQRVPILPKELYAALASSQKPQVIDVRSLDEYEDVHVPGAIPAVNCAVGELLTSVPTVIVSGDGNKEAFETCAAHFKAARNLEGGMAAWSDANLPEDSGEYVPPMTGAGGGCL